MKKVKWLIFSLISFLCFGVINVSAGEMSERFRLILNNEGKVELDAIKPNVFNEVSSYFSDYFEKYDVGEYKFGLRDCSEDFSSCSVLLYPPQMSGLEVEEHEIRVVYKNSDNNIKNKIDYYINNIPSSKVFLVSDLEAVNFWVNGCNSDSFDKCLKVNMSKYSSELKSFFEGYNIDYEVAFSTFWEKAGLFSKIYGKTVFKYNNISYGAKSNIGGQISNIIYVPTETETNISVLMETAQDRINEYLGSETAVVLRYGGLCSSLEYGESILSYLNLSNVEHYFIATVGGKEYRTLIVPDSSKMLSPNFFTKDLITGVEVNTNSNIPLDTILSVAKLTEGTNYERIISILNKEVVEMLDLRLFSKSANEYITSLEDGSFEVRIPISRPYKGKDLIVYYVDENNVKHEYPVTIEGDYAVFNTNHFSVYTLVVDNNLISNIDNPKTRDLISGSIILGGISLIGLFGVSIYLKKNRLNY